MSVYNLENRTKEFAVNIIDICNKIPLNVVNRNIVNQLIRSAGSIGANYLEANECDTKKDFKNKIRISKKEAKETIYWLELLSHNNGTLMNDIDPLIKESREIMNILGAIYSKIK
jgi:four helix bundle protein